MHFDPNNPGRMIYFICKFVSRDHDLPLVLKTVNPSFSQMTIFTDDMDLAGEVVASLATFLNIEHLHSTADFPEQMDELHGILSKVPASFFTVDIVLHLCVVCSRRSTSSTRFDNE